jgi:hypothetical protein
VTAGTDATQLLRPGLLDGVSILCAGDRGPLGEEVARTCAELGASVSEWQPGAERARFDLLCYDGDATFARASGDREALSACLELAWEVTRETVAAPLLESYAAVPDGGAEGRTGEGGPSPAHPSRIVYIAPVAGSRAHADAARAGLENLARTLSIEWARHGVTTVAIAPGASVAAGDVAALVAYLASPAGGYFSGCLFDLTGPAVSLPS